MKKALLISLSVISFQLTAATATTTVSANIVPISSFAMSDNIFLSRIINARQESAQTKANGARIDSGTLIVKKPTKVKINSSHNTVYDITISPSSILKDRASSKIEIKRLRALNNFDPLNNNAEQALMIEAITMDSNGQNGGFYSGSVEVNVNYN